MRRLCGIGRLILVFLLSVFFAFPIIVMAAEDHSVQRAKWTVKTLVDVKLVAKVENTILIDETIYVYDGKTKFIKYEQKQEKKVSVNKIVFPCQAQITYKMITERDEAHPYMEGQRILTNVIVQ